VPSTRHADEKTLAAPVGRLVSVSARNLRASIGPKEYADAEAPPGSQNPYKLTPASPAESFAVRGSETFLRARLVDQGRTGRQQPQTRSYPVPERLRRWHVCDVRVTDRQLPLLRPYESDHRRLVQPVRGRSSALILSQQLPILPAGHAPEVSARSAPLPRLQDPRETLPVQTCLTLAHSWLRAAHRRRRNRRCAGQSVQERGRCIVRATDRGAIGRQPRWACYLCHNCGIA
jgi:hypothetical protein